MLLKKEYDLIHRQELDIGALHGSKSEEIHNVFPKAWSCYGWLSDLSDASCLGDLHWSDLDDSFNTGLQEIEQWVVGASTTAYHCFL